MMKYFIRLILIMSCVINCYHLSAQGLNQDSSVTSVKEPKDTIDSKAKPLMLFDDTPIKSIEELQAIDPMDIQELVVIKKDVNDYIDKFGDEAKNGVVLVYSKAYVAKRWYKKFSNKKRKINKLINEKDFNYQDYIVYLDNELLKIDFFDKLDDKLENKEIQKIKFKKIKKDKYKGVIYLITKPSF